MEYKIIPLNIVLTYPVKWGKYEILRDFIQNFYDSVGYQEFGERFRYEYSDDTLSMWVDGISFSYDWLLYIGSSTKTADVRYAGNYGEGFKIASLCAVRDFGWNVTMSSDDWELSVITQEQSLDGKMVEMLAYKMHQTPKTDRSRLTLSPISDEEFQLFKDTITSYYYYGNPLLGRRLWEGKEGAVYLYSKEGYEESLLYTYGYGRKGAVFCGYQLLGSNPFGLVVCLHDYEQEDRERKALYDFHIIRVFEKIAHSVSPEAAMEMLVKMRRYWNSVPSKRVDIHSWSVTIKRLISQISRSSEVTRLFRERYPDLLYLDPVFTNAAKNMRNQARAWLSSQDHSYLLVQEAFVRLGYPSLEEVCERAGGFAVNDSPTELEDKGFELLEDIVKQIYADYFVLDNGFPERKIIRNYRASCSGMAELKKTRRQLVTDAGVPVRYDISKLYLKRNLFQKDTFYKALATYIHEMCHIFGGDASNAFSLALTRAMEILMQQHDIISEYNEKWLLLYPADAKGGLNDR